MTFHDVDLTGNAIGQDSQKFSKAHNRLFRLFQEIYGGIGR